LLVVRYGLKAEMEVTVIRITHFFELGLALEDVSSVNAACKPVPMNVKHVIRLRPVTGSVYTHWPKSGGIDATADSTPAWSLVNVV